MKTALLLLMLAGCPSTDTDTDTDTDTTCGDVDGDGVCDTADACDGDDATGDADEDGVCDNVDLCDGDDAIGDADRDGVCDGDADACVGDDATGDTDADGVCDDRDACEGDDATGDTDNDGICGDLDACVGDDATGDTDADGACDDTDQCDGDDLVGDSDLDGVCDDRDACDGNDVLGDSDGDGSCDDTDLCTGADPTGDSDADGICDDIDLCDGDDATGDDDGDGVCDDTDLCDGDDALGDNDFDGICDGDADLCFGNDTTGDTDGDGVCDDSDFCDGDDATGDTDEDGICDDIDPCFGANELGDPDGDGVCGGPWYVRPGNRPTMDGLSWDTAFPSLDAAFLEAAPGDAIWVAGDHVLDGVVTVPPGVAVLGGFAGNEDTPDARLTNGRVAIPSRIDFNTTRTSLRLSDGVTLEGFAIDVRGALGLYVTAASGVVVKDLTLLPSPNNLASDVGLVVERSEVVVNGLTCRNRTAGEGTCLSVWEGSQVTVTDLDLADVQAFGGAPIVAQSSALTVIGATGLRLSGASPGAGLLWAKLSDVTLEDVTLDEVFGQDSSALAVVSSGSLDLTDVRVQGIVTSGSRIYGGAIDALGYADVRMRRTTLANVEVSSSLLTGGAIHLDGGTLTVHDSAIGVLTLGVESLRGGAIALDNAEATIIGSTLGPIASQATEVAGSLVAPDRLSTLRIDNTVLWDAGSQAEVVTVPFGARMSGSHVCTPDPIAGVTNIVSLAADPLDIHQAEDGIRFTLRTTSPCLDTGSDAIADDVGIEWRTRTTRRDGAVDASPVDLGVHYDPLP